MNEAPPSAVKYCAFLRFTASAFPIYALIPKTTSQHCFHSRNRLSKKAEEDVSSPRTPRMSCWDHFAIHSHLLPHRRGFSSKRQGPHRKRPTCIFSAPSTWRHSISPNFFYKPNTAKSQRLHSTSPFLSMTKTLFFSSRRRSCYQCMPFSHSGGQVFPHNRHRFPKE